MKVAKILFGVMLVSGGAGWAQPVAGPVFEVASVRENKEVGGGSAGIDKGRYRTKNMPLKFIVSGAYGIRAQLVSGLPGWAESTRYDIDAKVDEDEAAAMEKMSSKERAEERNKLIQALLAERFHLQAKVVEKELPNYELVIAKGGLKMKESVPAANGGTKMPAGRFSLMVSSAKIVGQGCPFAQFTINLESQTDRQVVDKTGLTGKYDFNLQWTPDSAANSDSPWPDFFVAIEEQLGLKLIPSKGMQKTLVVEHLEKPTEN